MDELKRRAFEQKKSLKRVVNEVLDAGLRSDADRSSVRTFETTTFSMGEPAAGYDLDKALQLAGELEDQETSAKLEKRK